MKLFSSSKQAREAGQDQPLEQLKRSERELERKHRQIEELENKVEELQRENERLKKEIARRVSTILRQPASEFSEFCPLSSSESAD